MPRISRRLTHETERQAAAAQVAALVGPPREKKRRITSAPKARVEMERMRVDNDWTHARAVHMVALYEWCHTAVYGVAPDELTAGAAGTRARVAATGAATRMLAGDFRGDVRAMVQFLKWTWQRAKEKEEWAARSGAKLGRITWNAQFSGRAILTDYKVEIGRQHASRQSK